MLKKSILLGLSVLLLTACGTTSQTTQTTTTTTQTTAKPLSATEVYEKMQSAMNALSSYQLTNEVSMYPGTDTEKAIKTHVEASVLASPKIAMSVNTTASSQGSTITTEQYFIDSYWYVKTNDRDPVRRQLDNFEQIVKSQSGVNTAFANLLEKATVTEDASTYTITYTTENSTDEKLIEFFKSTMKSASTTDPTVYDRYDYVAEKASFVITVDKATFISKSSKMDLTVKVKDKSSTNTLTINLSSTSVISKPNEIKEITLPESFKNAQDL